MFRQFLCDMYRKIVLLLRVDNLYSFEFAYQYTCVAYLTTAFSIERSVAKYYLIQSLVFLFYLTVAEDGSFILSIVISYECSLAFFQCNPVSCFYSSSVTCTCFLFLHFSFEAFHIGSKTVFAEDKFSKVEWESECIIQSKCIYTADFSLSCSLSFVHGFVKQADTCFKSTKE